MVPPYKRPLEQAAPGLGATEGFQACGAKDGRLISASRVGLDCWARGRFLLDLGLCARVEG